jgi:multiple sugar transport system substrate-binding protein
MLLGWDMDAIDSKLNLNTTSPEAIECAKYYQNLQKNYAPAGVAGFNWNECQSAFALGQVAMWWDGLGFATPLEDPKTSKVVGKVAYVTAPKGPKAQWAGMTGDGMGISSFSKKKGPAWYYSMWAASKGILAREFAQGSGAQARNSVYTDADALKSLVVPKEWVDAVVNSGKIGRATLPIIVPVTEFRDIFGVALTNMIGGADPATELKKAQDEFKPILDKSET